MWRRQTAVVRSSQRDGPFAETVVPVVVVVLVVGFGLLSLWFEPAAAAAAVVKPANASRSPQARMERRNAVTSRVDCKSEAERAGKAPWASTARRGLCDRCAEGSYSWHVSAQLRQRL